MEQRIPRPAVPSTRHQLRTSSGGAASPGGARPRRGHGGGASSRAVAPASPRCGGGDVAPPARTRVAPSERPKREANGSLVVVSPNWLTACSSRLAADEVPKSRMTTTESHRTASPPCEAIVGELPEAARFSRRGRTSGRRWLASLAAVMDFAGST